MPSGCAGGATDCTPGASEDAIQETSQIASLGASGDVSRDAARDASLGPSRSPAPFGSKPAPTGAGFGDGLERLPVAKSPVRPASEPPDSAPRRDPGPAAGQSSGQGAGLQKLWNRAKEAFADRPMNAAALDHAHVLSFSDGVLTLGLENTFSISRSKRCARNWSKSSPRRRATG